MNVSLNTFGFREDCMPVTRREDVAPLRIRLPRLVTSMHQIEITSRCNLRCKYCPSIHITRGHDGYRPAVDMTEAHFSRALAWAEHYVRAGTQKSINLQGIGESTMHPQFLEYLGEARRRLGPDFQIILATNGVGYDEAFVQKMAVHRPHVWVSLHRPEIAGHAVQWFRAAEVLTGISADPSLNANDWAGQVQWFHSQRSVLPCVWLRQGMVMAAADGRLLACCLDATGSGAVGHVDDPIGGAHVGPYSLCADCHQEVGIEGYDQRAGVSDARLVQIGARP